MPRSHEAGDLRAQNPAPHLDTASHIGAPREPRWGGKQMPMTPMRRRAVDDKKAYARAVKAGVYDRAGNAATFASALADCRPLLLAHHIPVLAELAPRELRLFAALVLVHKRGHEGVTLKHGELAERLDTSVSSARRAMAALLARGYAYVVAPDFEPADGRADRASALHDKARHDRRGNVYAVPAAVLDSIDRVRKLLKSEQASGTEVPGEHRISGSSQPPTGSSPSESAAVERAECPLTTCGQSEPEPASPGVVSAARTVDFRRAAPAASIGVTGPARRQGETCKARPEAPEGAGLDELVAELGEQYRGIAVAAAEGNAFARELLADVLAQKRERERGRRGPVTLAEHLRRRDLAGRFDGGGDAQS